MSTADMGAYPLYSQRLRHGVCQQDHRQQSYQCPKVPTRLCAIVPTRPSRTMEEQDNKSFTDQYPDMSSNAVVRVGVGCLVHSPLYPGAVLMGRRKGSHGAGQLALPGGHLELGEAWETCAIRETKEETNLDIERVKFFHVVNCPNMGGDPMKHYVTVFMRGFLSELSAPLQNVEPHKCEGWEWVPWSDLVTICRDTPEVLFDPMIKLVDEVGEAPF